MGAVRMAGGEPAGRGGWLKARALSILMESEPGSSFLFEHDLIRKPVPTFRDHL
jgi:hypothetical protein